MLTLTTHENKDKCTFEIINVALGYSFKGDTLIYNTIEYEMGIEPWLGRYMFFDEAEAKYIGDSLELWYEHCFNNFKEAE